MANNESSEGDWEEEQNSKYKAPENRSLDELKSMDQEDESLRRYKEALLGSALKAIDPPFPDNPKNVIIDKFVVLIEGHPNVEIKLQGDLSTLKSAPISIPEGIRYRIQVVYYVQRDIVTGLRYKQTTSRSHIRVDKTSVMLGSYRPQTDAHVWTSDYEEAPKGTLQRGTYHMKSTFTDDYGTEYISWDWSINVTK